MGVKREAAEDVGAKHDEEAVGVGGAEGASGRNVSAPVRNH